jgi:hypothetical protein
MGHSQPPTAIDHFRRDARERRTRGSSYCGIQVQPHSMVLKADHWPSDVRLSDIGGGWSHWITVKNRKHRAFERVRESFC